MRAKGFTLIELVMVMAIIGILSVMAVVVISGAIDSIRLNSAADKVASDLRYAQTMSQGMGLWYGVSFEVDMLAPTFRYRRYSVYTTTGAADTVVENPAKFKSNFIVDVVNDYKVEISNVDIEKGAKVEFSPLGVPYADRFGAVVATDGVVTVKKGSATKTVRITPSTGRIYVQ